MNILKVIKKMFSGKPKKLAIPIEERDSEVYLSRSDEWPKEIDGELFLIDSTGDDDYEYHWAIGEFEVDNFKDSTLVEFQREMLIESGLCHLEELPRRIKLWINPAINEYYQVVKYEKI